MKPRPPPLTLENANLLDLALAVLRRCMPAEGRDIAVTINRKGREVEIHLAYNEQLSPPDRGPT